jgi:hypothetical protein
VGRLILFHLPDAIEVLRHHVHGLTDQGLALMIDFDVRSVRSEPPVALFDTATGPAGRSLRRRSTSRRPKASKGSRSDAWRPN